MRARVQIAYAFRKYIFAARDEFEEQYKIFDSPKNCYYYSIIIIIIIIIIITNAYCDFEMNAWHNYYISNTGPRKECDK